MRGRGSGMVGIRDSSRTVIVDALHILGYRTNHWDMEFAWYMAPMNTGWHWDGLVDHAWVREALATRHGRLD